jgi:hypothetical protein
MSSLSAWLNEKTRIKKTFRQDISCKSPVCKPPLLSKSTPTRRSWALGLGAGRGLLFPIRQDTPTEGEHTARRRSAKVFLITCCYQEFSLQTQDVGSRRQQSQLRLAHKRYR